MTLEVYHTQECRLEKLTFPILAEGDEQWLGDGFYFWQDYEFSKWWGDEKKKNKYKQFSIYKAVLTFDENSFIDTVFNEKDYYGFVASIEKVSKLYQKKYKKKPSLEEFNDFMTDFNIWKDICIVRFQDIPKNDYLMEVNGYYYKKRIQIRVNDPKIITNFVHEKDLYCV